MAKSNKFKPASPKFTGRGGGKNTTHDAAWIDKVVSNVAAGTPADQKRHAINYHGRPPKDGELGPAGPRPSVSPLDVCDVPGTIADQIRKLDPADNVPTHPHTKGAHAGPKVPDKCGAKSC